jgi:tetratricopeptide (TPR) repeat protein
MVHEKTNQFGKAMEYYNDSLKIEREIGDRAGEARTLHQIGRVHKKTNQFEKALEYYNESLKIAEETGNIYIENIIKNSIERVKRK